MTKLKQAAGFATAFVMLCSSVSLSGFAYEKEYDNDVTVLDIISDGGIDGYTVSGEDKLDIISLPYSERVGSTADTDVPEYYNLQEQGKVSSVRNQGTADTCWAFSTLGAVEQNLIAKEYENASVDLSETDLIWFSNHLYGDNGGVMSDEVYKSSSLFGPILAMTRNSGIEYDEYEPYFFDSQSSSVVSDVQKNLMEYYLDSVKIITNNSLEVKKAVIENGNAETSYTNVLSYFSEDGESYYNPEGTTTNHSVTIVGWDDNYSRENFKESSRPEHNGAWLVKSSWGSDVNDGYYWISYDETEMKTFYSFDMTQNDDTDKIYTYTNGTARGYLYSTDSIYGANVFTAQRNEVLKKVSFFVNENECKGTDYTVTVYKNLYDNSPKGSVVAAQFSGREEISGYYTVDLPQFVLLEDGEKYSVVVSLKNDNVKNYFLAEAGTLGNAESNPGESYCSTSGTDWADCNEAGYNNVYINAYTSSTDSVDKSQLELLLSDYENTVGMSRSLYYAQKVFDDNGASQTDVNNAVALIEAEGAEKNTYTVIRSVADWNDFAKSVNNGNDYKGKTVLVEKNINFDGRSFTVAGNNENQFNGFFDGDGHVLSNINLESNSLSGIFGSLGKSADIRNLVVSKCSFDGDISGGISGKSEAVNISGCGVYGVVNGTQQSGGIVGNYNGGSINNSYFISTADSVENTNDVVGKIVSEHRAFDNIFALSDKELSSGAVAVEDINSFAYLLNTNGDKNKSKGLWTTDNEDYPRYKNIDEFASCKVVFNLGDNSYISYTNYLGNTTLPIINSTQGVIIDWECGDKTVDEDTEFSKDSIVTGTPVNSYFVTYELDGGENDSENPYLIYCEDSVQLCDPEKEGYVFRGWYDNAVFSGEPITAIESPSEDITLYADFDINSFSVNFFGYEDSLLDTQQVRYGEAAVEPAEIPSVEGKYFAGWDKDFEFITDSTDVYAIYKDCTVITLAEIANFKETADYTGENITQSDMTLTVNENTLTENTDYTVEYSENVNVGTVTMTVNGIGKYNGSFTMEYNILPVSIEDMYVDLSKTEFIYDGEEKTPDVIIGELVKDKDFTVSYENNIEIGTATAVVTGTGNYCGSVSLQYNITDYAENDLHNAKINSIGVQSYLGIQITPLTTVTFNGKLLLRGRDYTVTYKDNVEIGTATATLTGKGNYTGSVELQFEIIQRRSTNVNKPRIIGRQSNPYTAVTTWVPDFTVNGSELMYSDNSDFKNSKTQTTEGYGNNFIAVMNSKQDKTNGYDNSKILYVKVRSFIYVNGEKVYSQWSDTRTINPYVK